eukprot:s2990_g19.t1
MDPNIAGPRFRTTLVKDKGEWFVLELCEALSSLVDLSAPFHEFEGERSVLTFISDGEKDPKVLGFAWADDDVLQPGQAAGSHDFDEVEVVAPEDVEVQGIDIDNGDIQQQDGVEIQDRILVEPMREDKLVVNGVELTATSSLAALRAGLSFYNLSTSGSKQKCFTKLPNHAKRLELETVTAAAKNAQMDEQRVPSAPPLAVPPSDAEQQQHALTHWPYANWCASCDPARVKSLTCLVMVCSQTGYMHCTPVKHKNQFDLMVRELLTFAQLLGHSELVYMSDNEPTMLQLLRMVVNARLSMGSATRSTTPQAYSHGNYLAENAIGRVRALAGTFMHYISQQIGVELSTSNALWSWALRHASWVLNRFNTNQGMSAYELVTGKSYKGATCVFGEPLFGYSKTNNKGSAKWARMLFVGKVDPQDSFILYNGTNLVLVKSVRRIKTDWRGHLAFYLNFKCPSFDYQSGFGGRVVPTKGSRRDAISASFKQPQGAIEPSAFFDADGAAGIEKAKEEKREELETFQMGKWDRPEMVVEEEPLKEVGEGEVFNPTNIWGDEDEQQDAPGGPSSGHADVPVINADDQGYVPNPSLQLDAPRTPVELLQAPTTPKSPRASPTTRVHGDEAEEEHDQKRSRVESHKKARIERLKEERSAMIRVVQIAEDEFPTMDSYDTDPQMDDHVDYDDPWKDEDAICLDGIPEELWSDVDPSVHPSNPPSWIDQLADKVELHRLCKMGVLMPEDQYGEEVKAKLTTRFVYDWRLKDYKGANNDEPARKRWLRRSRCVAREYAFLERREDTFAPASSTHVLNLLPMLWLQKLADQQAAEGLDTNCDWILATLDVKDAFLMVPLPEPLKIKVGNESYIVLKNLPGQRQGARSWYQFLRSFLDQTFGAFTISYSELGGIDSEVVFLKRRIKRTMEVEASNEKWWFKVGVMVLVFILIAFAVGCFFVQRYVRKLLVDLHHLSVQVAEADTVIGQHMNEMPALRRDLNGLRAQLDDVSQRTAVLTQQVIERDENMESLSDRQDGLHYGLVELGGFVRTNELTPPQRRHMYKYLRTVRSQSRGFARGGEDTDAAMPDAATGAASAGAEGEAGESSDAASDEIRGETELNPEGDTSTRRGELTATVDELRTQLHDALTSESWRDAAELQQTILMLLERLNTSDLRDPAARRAMYDTLAERMERLSRRVRRNNNQMLADQHHFLEGFISDPFDECQLWLFADADHAGEHDSKSTSGSAIVLVGPNTYYPLNTFSKKQTVVAICSTEAAVVAANHSMRAEGIPMLALFEQLNLVKKLQGKPARVNAQPDADPVFTRIDPEIDEIRNGNVDTGCSVADINSLKASFPEFYQVKFMEDNQATITVISIGSSASMRRMNKTQNINFKWLKQQFECQQFDLLNIGQTSKLLTS